MKALLTSPFRVGEIGFGRVHKIKPGSELLFATAHVKTVAIVVLGIHVLAIRQHDAILLAYPRLSDDDQR
jgi:hypothetical protein